MVVTLKIWLNVYFCGRHNLKKLTYEERKAKLIERLNALNSAAGADDDDEDDEWTGHLRTLILPV